MASPVFCLELLRDELVEKLNRVTALAATLHGDDHEQGPASEIIQTIDQARRLVDDICLLRGVAGRVQDEDDEWVDPLPFPSSTLGPLPAPPAEPESGRQTPHGRFPRCPRSLKPF